MTRFGSMCSPVWSVGIAIAVVGAVFPVGAQTGGVSLSGVTRTGDGAALEGVAVSARAMGSTLTTTVYTDAQGEYFFPELDGGEYSIWAQATGYGTARAELALDPAHPAREDFSLHTVEDFSLQLSGSEWLAALPDGTFEERRMKEIFRVQCTECHQPNYVLQHRFDERGWRAIIDVMEKAGYGGVNPTRNRPPVAMRHHKNELAKYLATIRGPDSAPLSFEPHPRPSGDAARVVITEYDVPPAETPNELVLWNGSDWSEGTPSGQRGGRGLHDLQIDANGNAWVTDSLQNTARTLVKVDSKTGAAKAYKLVDDDGKLAMRTHGIAIDRDGIMWFNASNYLARLDPETETFKTYLRPYGLRIGGTLDADAAGRIWTSTSHGALQFDPQTETFRFFPPVTMGDGQTYGVAGDANGNGWWANWLIDIVGHGNSTTGRSHEVRIHPPDMPGPEHFMTEADAVFYHFAGARRFMNNPFTPGSQAPRRLDADRNGDTAWVANWWGGNLARIDINTFKVTYHRLPYEGQHPYAVVVGDDHMVWTNVQNDDVVAKLNPITGEWTQYRLPSRGSEARWIAHDQYRGDIWVPYFTTSRIARLQFRTEEEIEALRSASNGQ